MSTPTSPKILPTRPPELPLSDVREAGEVAQPATDDSEVAALSLAEQLKSSAAVGYYISAVLHIVAYGAMALVFAYFATKWNEQEVAPPIRASLDDFNRQDELPEFEEVGEIDLGRASSKTVAQQLNSLIQSDNATTSTAIQEMTPSLDTLDAVGPGGEADDDSFKFRVPKSGFAVTKGSFTAWTVPETPEPGQRYRIVIQIKLPDGINSYRLSDLNGRVTGTDGYTQTIPYDKDKRFAVSYTDQDKQEVTIKSRTERIDVRNNKIQLVVVVPGAQRLVKDVIKLKSRRLREDHEISLVFGSRNPERDQ